MLNKTQSLFWPCVCSLCYYNCLCRSYLPGVSIKGRGGWRGLKGERANTERQLHTSLCEKGVMDFRWKKEELKTETLVLAFKGFSQG